MKRMIMIFSTAALLSAAILLPAGCEPAPDAADAPAAGATPDVSGVFAGVFAGSAGRWVDLTHPFSESTVYWPTDTIGFVHEELAYGPTEAGFFYAAYRFESAEHGGTHLDAPIHFAEGRRTVDEIPLSDLIGPAAVVDVSDRAHPDYLVSVADLEGWESEHGTIPDGAILLLRTGWDARWGDRAAYLGTGLTGPDAVAELHFPGLDPEAARWLVEYRNIVALGLDTPSLDYGQSEDFAAHVILNSDNIAGFENLANLGELPATGAFVVALPMKIEGGSGGPLRIVAFVPEATDRRSDADESAPEDSTPTAELREALQGLVRGSAGRAEGDAGSSWFSAETADALRSVAVDSTGHATVDFADLRPLIPNASSSAGSASLLAELNATVFQFPGIRSVEYRMDGSCDRFWEWLQYACRTVTRESAQDWR